MGSIYLVTNRVNGKRYVGKTIRTIETRWWQHCYDAINDCSALFHKAIRKHGVENFEIEELFQADDETLLFEHEKLWIAKLHTNVCRDGVGYNMTDGGEGPSGFKISEETRQRMSAAQMGKRHTDETKRKLAAANRTKGQKRSDETKHKMSLVQRGKKRSLEVRRNLSLGHAKQKKPVEQLTMDGDVLQRFESLSDAQKCLRENGRPKASYGPVRFAADGRTDQAYGYRWRWI